MTSDDLLDYLAARFPDLSLNQYETVIPVTTRTIYRWKKSACKVSDNHADEIAGALKVHPSAIWGMAWHEAAFCSYPKCETLKTAGQRCAKHSKRKNRKQAKVAA